MNVTEDSLKSLNNKLAGQTPSEIIQWALAEANKPIVTTNFRPYEVAILHAVSNVKPDIPVIWCDTGYNTPNTYKHADEVIARLRLDIDLYVPRQSSAYRDAIMGVPSINDKEHTLFTEQVKLEPFSRAMKAHHPDVWFTNLRKGQTLHRDSLDILSLNGEGILKVSPFYYWSDLELDTYLRDHNLPNEHTYFDPTKVLGNRECGLHN